MSDRRSLHGGRRLDLHRRPRGDPEYQREHQIESPYPYIDEDPSFEPAQPPSNPSADYGFKFRSGRTNRRRGRQAYSEGDNYGYGGLPSNGRSDRFLHGAPPYDEYPPYQHHQPTAINFSAHPHDQERSQFYGTETNRGESHSRTDTFTKQDSKQNVYKGGCPYSYQRKTAIAQGRGSSRPQAEDPSPLLKSADSQAADVSSKPLQHYRTPQEISGPYKQMSSSVSPVKPLPVPSTSKPVNSPIVQKPPCAVQAPSAPYDGNTDVQNLDTLVPAHDVSSHVHRLQSNVRTDKKTCRTLSCEKKVRPKGRDLHGRKATSSTQIPHLFSPIAPPVEWSSASGYVAGISEEVQDDSSRSNRHSRTCEVRDTAMNFERTENQILAGPKNEGSIPKSFTKALRMPQSPEGDLSGGFTPDTSKKDNRNPQERKATPKYKTVQRNVKLPRLRSEPAPATYSIPVDNSPRIATSGTRERAQTVEQDGSKPQTDHSNFNGRQSSTSPPPIAPHNLEDSEDSEDSEASVVSDPNVQTTKHKLTSSMAKLNLLEQRKPHLDSIRVFENQGAKHADQQASNDEKVHTNISDGEVRTSAAYKRKANGGAVQRETRAKRPRSLVSHETVNLDDSTTLRRSRRFQPLKTTNDWEAVKFEKERVHAIFMNQLQRQPMLLRISFLGMCDSDLRDTLDLWKSTKGSPDPDLRRLEANNNRIRRISNYTWTQICALKVISLNLSCNLLTSIGVKIGLSSKLKFLNISRNQLSCLPQELCDLTNLEVLNMSHNNISRLPSGLSRLIRLEVLSLAWNSLEVLPEDVTAEGAALSDLDLSHNEDFHFFPRCAEHWTRLEVLHMPNTTIHKSLSKKELRMRAATLVKELAGRKRDMFNSRTELRSH